MSTVAYREHGTYLLCTSSICFHSSIQSSLYCFRDVEVHTAPLLLDDIPEELGADDGAQQHIILDSLRDSAGDLDGRAACYEDAPVIQVPLSKLQSNWENKNVTSAFRLLRSRSEIVIDDEFKCDPHDKNLAYNLSQHRLDFLLVMSSRIGFDAILPNSRSDTTFIFRLDLHQPQRSLKLKHSDLGFPMDHKALFIGRARGKDLVYLVMAPNAFIAQEEDDTDDIGDPAPSKGRVRTNMSGRHYWMLVMFMAFIFEKHFPHRDVYCHEHYPNIDQNAWKNVRAATNIMYAGFLLFPVIHRHRLTVLLLGTNPIESSPIGSSGLTVSHFARNGLRG